MIPVFICGYQKSGTTLLASLLDGHPEMMMFPEETSFLRWVNKGSFDSPESMLEFQLQRTHVSRLRTTSANDPLEGPRDYNSFDYDRFENKLRQDFLHSSGTSKQLMDQIMASFAEVTGQSTKKYWVEKTPRNECYWKDSIKLYPQAKYLYIYRDPRDVYCSYKINREKFLQGEGTLKLGNFILTWTDSLKCSLKLPESSVLFLRYENLVRTPEVVLDRICKFLDISFTESLKHPTKLGTSWLGNSMHGDRFSSIDTSAIGRYRSSPWKEDIACIEYLLGPFMRILDYGDQSPDHKLSFWNVWQRIPGQRKKVIGNIIALRIQAVQLRKKTRTL